MAVKVQRPGAQVVFERDFDILRDLVRYTRLHTLLRMTRQQLAAIIDEVIGFTRSEFDYCHEAEAARRLRAMEIEGMYVPQVYDELCTRRVLVTEFIAGRHPQRRAEPPGRPRLAGRAPRGSRPRWPARSCATN